MENSFKNESSRLLLVLQEKCDRKLLKKIKIKNLIVLVDFLNNYKPKSKIRKEKEDVLEYLNALVNEDSRNIKKDELLKLRIMFIDPILNKFIKFGFRRKYDWVLSLFFILLFDFLINYLTGIYIPVFSIIFTVRSLIKEQKARKQGKLW